MFFIILIIVGFVLGKLIYRILGHFCWIPKWKTKSVMITGCDSGFGFYTTLKLVDQGVRVFAGCLSFEGEQNLSISRPNSPNLHVMNLNIVSDISVEEVQQMVREILGSQKLWALINNAGISLITGPDDFMSMQHYRQHMEVNFFGQKRVTQAFKPLIKQSKGRIIFVTSIQGRLALPETAPYNASKWATEAYADSLRRELWDFGIRVLVVQPDGFRTKLNVDGWKNYESLWGTLPESVKQEYGKSYYQDRLTRQKNVQNSQSSNMEMVPNAIMEALFSKFWRYRYVVGIRDIRMIISWMPEWIQDFYVRWKDSAVEKPMVLVEKSKKS